MFVSTPGQMARRTLIGDADDGRLLRSETVAGAIRARTCISFAKAVFQLAGREACCLAAGGYWVMRTGDLYAIVRCGDVGVAGLGSHAHNDQLSFEFAVGSQPLVVDPGAFLYTADPEARNLFRSTSFHATLRIGGIEQQEAVPGTLFALEDCARAEALNGSHELTAPHFRGRHHGFERLDPPATHERRIELDGPASTLRVSDLVLGEGSHELEWSFPLAPCDVRNAAGEIEARFPGASLVLPSPDLRLEVEEGWYSPSYGVRGARTFVRARRPARPGRDLMEFYLRVLPS